MSGHSHWSGIKHKKEAADQKRGQVFSKFLAAVSIAARGEPNPQFNPRLRTAVEKARQSNVPQENIERAIRRVAESPELLEELVLEAYGPAGIAMLIEAITDSRNRTVAEIKNILNKTGGKWADAGSVRWAFISTPEGWQAKFPQTISSDDRTKLNHIIGELEAHGDVQRVLTNAQ